MSVRRQPNRRRPGATLHDVARLAGVSARTVSRVVNEEGGFGEEVRIRVEDAIHRTGYKPNRLARALITKKSGIVGLVVPNVTDPYFAELADAVQTAAQARGLTILFLQHRNDVAEMGSIINTLASFAADGIIAFTALGEVGALLEVSDRMAIVLVDQILQAPNVGSLYSTIADGAEAAVTHLAERGRTAIAMIANLESSLSPLPARREGGYQRGLHRAHLAFDSRLLARGVATIEGGRAATEQLIDSGVRFDALFAYNDLMAVGAMQALTAAGRRIPQDVALVGFDDIALCAALVPRLSSVRLDRSMAAQAFDLLDRLLKERGSSPDPIPVATTLVVRESS